MPAKVRRMEIKRRGMEYASRCGVDNKSPVNVEPDDGDGDDGDIDIDIDIEPDGHAVYIGSGHGPVVFQGAMNLDSSRGLSLTSLEFSTPNLSKLQFGKISHLSIIPVSSSPQVRFSLTALLKGSE